VLGVILKSRLSVENPSKLQIVLEDLVSGLVGLIEEWLGPNGRRYLPLLGALGAFILVSNYIGLVPGFMAPTSNINVTVGCALTTWVFYHLQGIRTQGLVAYVLHFAFPPGAPKALAPLMLPIELISHMARLLSLSLRLFGNIFGEEMVIAILAFLVPYFVPLPIMLLGLITGGLQAFVFVLLSIIYLQGATHIEHEDHGHEHDTPATTHGDKRGAGELAAA
jgi:F-type H+-transporting ATPase subunit a